MPRTHPDFTKMNAEWARWNRRYGSQTKEKMRATTRTATHHLALFIFLCVYRPARRVWLRSHGHPRLQRQQQRQSSTPSHCARPAACTKRMHPRVYFAAPHGRARTLRSGAVFHHSPAALSLSLSAFVFPFQCSTGSTALFMAKQFIQGGLAECVMALGFEKMEKGSLGMKFPDRTNPMDMVGAHALRTRGDGVAAAMARVALAAQRRTLTFSALLLASLLRPAVVCSFTQHMGVMSESHGLAPKVPFAPQMFGNAGREHMKLHGQWRSTAAAAAAVSARLEPSHFGDFRLTRALACVPMTDRHDSDSFRQDRREEPPPLG